MLSLRKVATEHLGICFKVGAGTVDLMLIGPNCSTSKNNHSKTGPVFVASETLFEGTKVDVMRAVLFSVCRLLCTG